MNEFRRSIGTAPQTAGPKAAEPPPPDEPRAVPPWARLVAAVVMTVVGVGYVLEAWRLGVGGMSRAGPGFFPALAGGLLTLSALALVVRSVHSLWHARATEMATSEKASRTEGAQSAGTTDGGAGRKGAGHRTRLLTVAVLPLAYVVGMSWVGHLVTSTVVLSVATRLIGGRAWWKCVAFGLLVTVGSHLIFAELLAVPLPAGLYGPRF